MIYHWLGGERKYIMKNVKTLTKAELEMMKENMDIYVSEGYTVTAQKPVIGEVYHNFLENVDYCATENDTDKVLLIGTVGEPWFADINKVIKDYVNIDGTDLTTSNITSTPIRIIRKTSYNAGIQLAEDTDVITSNGHVLHAKEGDFLVCSTKEENDIRIPDDEYGYWTINKKVFYNTNELTGGKCGNNLNWFLNKEGFLIISGTEDMYDYDVIEDIVQVETDYGIRPMCVGYKSTAPWSEYVIKTVIIKNGVESIGSNAFYDCEKIENVFIPDSVEYIANYAFYNCSNLINLTIPNNVRYIGKYAFAFTGLTNIILPTNMKDIKEFTFLGCSNLTNITIPNNIINIEFFSFDECENLNIYYKGTKEEWDDIKGNYRLDNTKKLIYFNI
jgi:hypothetical protein